MLIKNLKFKILNNSSHWINFLPLLLIYLLIIVFYHKTHHNLIGDEGRYLMFAENLLQGFYSPPPPKINLWNGPGYPFILAVFKALGFNIFALRCLNAILLYLSVIFFYKTLLLLKVKKSIAIGFSFLLGLYYPLLIKSLPFILTEVVSFFLISLINYQIVSIWLDSFWKPKQLLWTGFLLTFLMHTKVIFSHAVLAWGIICLGFCAFSKEKIFRKTCLIIAMAFVFSIPYLFYTYSLTGKMFYWSNAGGSSLYWMSSPYINETGSWFYPLTFQEKKEEGADEFSESGNINVSEKLRQNHGEFFKKVSHFNALEKDSILKKQAITNIKNNPKKYVYNWVCNVGRLLFNFPYSYQEASLRTYFWLFPNFILIGIILFSLVFLSYYKIFSPVFWLMTLFYSGYLFGSSFLSAYNRMFYITLPFWMLIVAFCLHKLTIFFDFASKKKLNQKQSMKGS